MVQKQLINNRLMVANTLQESLQQQELLQHLELQPVYTNGSNNNIINKDIFDSSLQNVASDHQCAVNSDAEIDTLQLSPFFHEDENEDPLAFADQILQYL